MIPAALRAEVLEANLELVRRGLVVHAFGNASGIDRETGRVVIKPSGIPYEELTADSLVVTDLDGTVLAGGFKPSSDLPTHLALYRAFPRIGGVVHTHSRFATVWAQAGREIPCLGTTHADYFRGDIPVTRPLRPQEIERDYERNTGLVIVETFRDLGLDAREIPAALVANHGPFAWGADAAKAIEHARVLEYVARLEWRGRLIDPDAARPDQALIDKHHLRKHGPGAYYGQ